MITHNLVYLDKFRRQDQLNLYEVLKKNWITCGMS